MSSGSTEEAPLVDQITHRTIEALSAREEFDAQTVERLRELRRKGHLNSWESIVKSLTGEEEG